MTDERHDRIMGRFIDHCLDIPPEMTVMEGLMRRKPEERLRELAAHGGDNPLVLAARTELERRGQ